MNDSEPAWIIVNNQMYRRDEPLLPVDARAVRYGDGCFETFRSYKGRFLKLKAHLHRLKGALEYLRIAPPLELDYASIKQKILKLMEKNNLVDVETVVRIQVWREGGRGFSVTREAGSGYCITVSELPQITESVSLATVATRRIPAQAMSPKYKVSNSINYIQAATEATEQEADDALMLTMNGFVAETTIANLFWYRDQKVFTPSPVCDILPGITRQIVLDILNTDLPVSVTEGEFVPSDLMQAESVWICNSVRELVQVEYIDQQNFTIKHTFFDKLNRAFELYRNQLLD